MFPLKKTTKISRHHWSRNVKTTFPPDTFITREKALLAVRYAV